MKKKYILWNTFIFYYYIYFPIKTRNPPKLVSLATWIRIWYTLPGQSRTMIGQCMNNSSIKVIIITLPKMFMYCITMSGFPTLPVTYTFINVCYALPIRSYILKKKWSVNNSRRIIWDSARSAFMYIFIKCLLWPV